jgi:hypothetical protein
MKWVYKTKTTTNGSMEKLKACLVVLGFKQQKGINYEKTFAPIVKRATIRMVVVLAVQHNWSIKHLDVKTTF